MNTEQLKTAEEILDETKQDTKNLCLSGMYTLEDSAIINAMNSFASQESKRAVDEYKEKLKAEILSMRNNRHAATASWTLQEAIDLIDKL